MHPSKANLINAVILIALGLWGSISANFASPTAFIAPVVGLILLLLTNGLKNGNSIMSHIAVALTGLMFLVLFKPLMGGISNDGFGLSTLRVIIMMFSCIIALVVFFKHFSTQRKLKR